MTIVARRVSIRGEVQGVGYRMSLVEVADFAGLVGLVRNRADGSVEAILQGDLAAVERVTDWCRRGPPAARVVSVDVEAVGVEANRRDFGVDYTG